jgi:hypothetical protein
MLTCEVGTLITIKPTPPLRGTPPQEGISKSSMKIEVPRIKRGQVRKKVGQKKGQPTGVRRLRLAHAKTWPRKRALLAAESVDWIDPSSLKNLPVHR